MKRVLIVTPRWIPLVSPDMQRVRASLPYYRANGWEPVLLCVDPEAAGGVPEPALADTVPGDIKVYRCGAIPPRWARWLGIGSLGLRAWFPLLRAGRSAIEREKIDLVFVSTTEFVVTAAARLWKQATGTPYIVDVQDPWRTSHYERPDAPSPPGGWKYQFARFVAWSLEESSFSRAAALMSVSPLYLETLRERYRWMATMPTAAIPFGAADRDLPRLTASRPSAGGFSPRAPHLVHLVYTGAAGPILPHAVGTLFAAFRRYREAEPARAARLRFHFIGTRYVPPGAGDEAPLILPVAERWGVESHVEETAHRVGYVESLHRQLQSDALLLLGSIDPAYAPSKLAAYFRSQKPILALVHAGSHLESLLQPLSCAQIVSFSPGILSDKTYREISHFFDLATDGFPPGSLPVRNEAHFEEHFGAAPLTRRQCALFDDALGAAQRGFSAVCP